MVDKEALPPPRAGRRRLVVLRHAKSAWPEGVPDPQRPLADRGRRDAPAAGRWLRAAGFRPDLVLVSPARRTRQTWNLVADQLDEPPEAVLEPRLYHAEAEALLEVLHELPSGAGSVLLVGHNPELQELVLGLAGKGGGKSLALAREKFPTSAIAVLDWKGGWRDLAWGGARLRRMAVPRGLPG
ncbi:histidine phosphatase family protein [Streptomyces sp. NPDC051940]|uniref:SixA phosphatase family protein n=1 Tax=Streptomyces sp. NPDC051940 TaxID=3155675 RepID=UPI003413B310